MSLQFRLKNVRPIVGIFGALKLAGEVVVLIRRSIVRSSEREFSDDAARKVK